MMLCTVARRIYGGEEEIHKFNVTAHAQNLIIHNKEFDECILQLFSLTLEPKTWINLCKLSRANCR